MNWDTLPEKYADLYPEDQLKRDRNRTQGLANKREGDAFEYHISCSLIRYKEAGLAEIEKTPEPIRQIGKKNHKGQFLACYTKRAQPDYKGTLPGGRSVVFEAKATTQDKIEQSAVTEDQRQRLDHHHQLGAVAFVLVGMNLTDFYRVPWEVWRSMKETYGHKHMKRDELEPYRVAWRNGMIQLLDGIIEQGATMKKIEPLIRPKDIDDDMAIEIMSNAIFNMSMSDDLSNNTLCLLAAMRCGVDALKLKKARKEQSHD